MFVMSEVNLATYLMNSLCLADVHRLSRRDVLWAEFQSGLTAWTLVTGLATIS